MFLEQIHVIIMDVQQVTSFIFQFAIQLALMELMKMDNNVLLALINV